MKIFDILEVYHGGTDVVDTPRVDVGRLDLDFGPGFYVTDIYSQAKDWASIVGDRRDGLPCINVYRLRQRELLKVCNSKVFEAYDAEWLDFVAKSRLGQKPWQGYDYIEGGVADDRVVNAVRLFMSGYISAEETINRLQYFKPNNQICLLNQELLDEYLTFVESINPNEND